MKKIFFKDIIKYDESKIKFFDDKFTLNLSTLLYSEYATNPLTRKKFSLFNIIDVFDLVVQYFDGKNYIVFVQPDFQKLITFFGYNLPRMESSIESISNRTKSSYYTECKNALQDIEYFIVTRNLPEKLIREISPYEEHEDEELLNLIKNLNCCFSKPILDLTDYFCELTEGGKYSLVKEKKSVPVDCFYNYQSLRYFCTRTALSNNEYHNYHYLKKSIINKKEREENNLKIKPYNSESKRLILQYEKMLEEINEIIDKINDNKFYNTKTFALLSLKLELLEKQEEALDEFIYKILNKQLETVEAEVLDNSPADKTNEKIKSCIEKLMNYDTYEQYPELGVDWFKIKKYGFNFKDEN